MLLGQRAGPPLETGALLPCHRSVIIVVRNGLDVCDGGTEDL